MSPASYRTAPPRVGLRIVSHALPATKLPRESSLGMTTRTPLGRYGAVMTTTPPDPFSNQSSSSYQAGGPPPAPPLPGQGPPPIGAIPGGWAPEKPSGLALWTIIGTGAVTALTVISALLAPANLSALEDALESGTTPGVGVADAIGGLTTMLMIASYVILALWMTKIRSNLRARGIVAGGPPAVEWWGWFVPLANFVLPFLGMKAISRGKASVGLQLGWWLPFCAYWLTSIPATVASFSIIDWQTGEVSNTDALQDALVWSYVAAVLLAVSWAFLAVIVRRVTDKHLED